MAERFSDRHPREGGIHGAVGTILATEVMRRPEYGPRLRGGDETEGVVVWQDGYVSGIEYGHAFHGETSPSWIAFALTLAGFEPPTASGDFAYCELGCGQGLTSNMLAAIHPDACFEAVDFLKPHIAGARALAAESGHDNARFLAQSFADFATSPGPQFDLIALHGVWSWVGDETRAILIRILAERLKPGGAVYVSYNCLPGWAADMPVRRLLLDHVAAGHGPMAERIARALDFARTVSGLGGYFDRVPSAAAHVESLAGRTDSYIAHEYLNLDWAPFYHADLVRDLAAAGLDYAGPATLLDRLDSWRMPPEAAGAVAATKDPLGRETLRDFLAHTRFRRDLFVKGARRLDPERRRNLLEETVVGPKVAPSEIPEEVSVPGGGLAPGLDLFAPVAAALAAGPRRLGEVAAALPSRPFDEVVDAVTALAGLDILVPVPAYHPRRAERTSAFNAAALRHPFTIRQLASPVLGTGIVVDILDRLFLGAMAAGRDPVIHAWEALDARGRRLRRHGEWLDGEEESRSELARLLAEFRDLRLGRLQALGLATGRAPDGT